jgi:hypothetical protein
LIRYYLAYGSNLLTARLRARTPSAHPLGVVSITGYSLRFHKIGTDGSAKCDAFRTDDPRDLLWGVVYGMDPAEQPILDRIEGVGSGYALETMRLTLGGRPIEAFTYLVEPGYIDADLRPFHWYKQFVYAGALEHGFAPDYAERIAASASVEDPDRARADRNRQILATAGVLPADRGKLGE